MTALTTIFCNAQNNDTKQQLRDAVYLYNFAYLDVDTNRVSDFYKFSNDVDLNKDIIYLKENYDLAAMLLLDDELAKRYLKVDTSHTNYKQYEMLQNQYFLFKDRINSSTKTQFFKVNTPPNKSPKEALLFFLSEQFNKGIIDSVCMPPEENSLILTTSIKDNKAIVHTRSRYRYGFSKYYIVLELNHLVITPIVETIDFKEQIKFAKRDRKINVSGDKTIKRLIEHRINRNSYGLGLKFGIGMSKICNMAYLSDPFFSHGLAYSVGITYDFTVSPYSKLNNAFMQTGIFYTNYSSYFDTKVPNVKQIYYVNSYNLHLKPFGYRYGFGKGNSIDFSLGVNLGLIRNYGKYKLIPFNNTRFTFGGIISAGMTFIDYINFSINYTFSSSKYDSAAYAVHNDFPIAQSAIFLNLGFNFGPLMKKKK